MQYANLSFLNVENIMLWLHSSTYTFKQFSGSQSCIIPSPVGAPHHMFSSSVLPNHIYILASYHEQSLHRVTREWQHTTETNMQWGCIQNLPHGTCQSLLGKAKVSGPMMAWATNNQSYSLVSSTYILYITQLFVFLSLCFVIALCDVIIWCQSNTKKVRLKIKSTLGLLDS